MLVADPWRKISTVGFVMWLLGSAGLAVSGRRSGRRSGKTVELGKTGDAS
jgi:hypothetical protein